MKEVVACLLFFIVFVLPTACKKGGCNVIPYVPFSTTISLVEFSALRLPMQPVIVERGVASGLIVMQISENEYVAYDRRSTVNPETSGCAVELAESGPVAVDPCSGAKYILTNGSPSEIAECPLRPYYVRRQQDILTISN